MTTNTPLGIVLNTRETLPKALEIASKPLSSDFVDVSGFGELAWITLSNSSEDEKTTRFDGPLQLINLRGRIRRAGKMVISDFVCTVSRETDNGIQVLGGKLVSAAVNHLEVTFSPLENDTAPRPASSSTPPPSIDTQTSQTEPVSPPDEEPPAASPFEVKPAPKSAIADQRWAKAVLESRRIEEETDYLDDSTDIRPVLGDLVNHKQFGECTVARLDDDHLTLRKPDGRHVQLGLQILVFKRVGHKNGKDLFDVEVGSRR